MDNLHSLEVDVDPLLLAMRRMMTTPNLQIYRERDGVVRVRAPSAETIVVTQERPLMPLLYTTESGTLSTARQTLPYIGLSPARQG